MIDKFFVSRLTLLRRNSMQHSRWHRKPIYQVECMIYNLNSNIKCSVGYVDHLVTASKGDAFTQLTGKFLFVCIMLHWRKCRDLFESLGSIDFSANGIFTAAWESNARIENTTHQMIWKLVFIRTYAVIVTRTTSKMFQNGDTAGVYIFIDTRRGMCSFRKQLKYNWVYKDYCSIVKTRRHPTDYTYYCTNIFFNCSLVDDFT